MLRKYIIKYKTIPIQLRASFWFLVCGILQNGLSIITLPIFTHILTTEQYGLSSTYFAWYDLFAVICTLRLYAGVFDKGLLRYEYNRDYFTSSLLGLTTTISASFLLVFLLFHISIEKALDMSFHLCFSLFAIQIFAPALMFWTERNKFEYTYVKFTIVTIGAAISCTIINLIAVLLIPYDRGEVRVLSYQFVWLAVYIVFYIYIFLKGKCFFDREIWRYALRFNLPLLPSFLSTIILDKADRIMIKYFFGQSEVALYSVSYNLGKLMVLLTSALDATFTPWIYRKIKSNFFKNSKQISASIMFLFLGVSTVFMLFAPELIMIFAPEQYLQAVYIIPSIVASYFFIMLYGIVSKIEFYYEKTKLIAAVTVTAAVLDIVLNYFAIPIWGYVAAGYTTLLCYICSALLHFCMAYRLAVKNHIVQLIFPWKLFLQMSVLMLIITFGINIIYPYQWVRWGLIVVVFIIFLFNYKSIFKIVNSIKSD